MRNIIWQNDVFAVINELEFSGSFDACQSDTEKWRFAEENMQNELRDIESRLTVDMSRPLYAFADIVRWDGTHAAFRELRGTCLKDCIDAALEGEDIVIFVEDGELRAEWLGHDNPFNPSRIVFRVMRDGEDKEDLEDAFLDGKGREAMQRAIWQYTEPLGDVVMKALEGGADAV